MAESPLNYYSTNGAVGAAATCGVLRDFGFPAKTLRVYNAGTVDLYVNLRGLNACTMSTGVEHVIASATAEIFYLTSHPVGSIALWTTSTVAAGQKIGTLAMG